MKSKVMLMKLTKRRALEICRDLWKWLASHPGRSKDEWPGWGKYGEMESNCPCCEFNNQHQHKYCDDGNCLIEWPDGSCCSSKSPFSKWATYRPYAPRYAREIVKLAEKALRKLNKKKVK